MEDLIKGLMTKVGLSKEQAEKVADFLQDNASKVALAWLAGKCAERAITVIDCQMPSAHLRSMGSRPLPRHEFLAILNS